MDEETRTMEVNWWGMTIRGIIAILFGIAALFWPGLTLVTLVYIFSAWILVDGILRMVLGLVGVGQYKHWFLALLLGLLEVGVGVYLIRHPAVSFATLILLIGFTLIAVGVVEAVSAFTIEKSAGSKTLSIIWGIVAVIAGIVVLMQPVSSGVTFVWILGLYAIITGPILIASSLHIRKAIDANSKKR